MTCCGVLALGGGGAVTCYGLLGLGGKAVTWCYVSWHYGGKLWHVMGSSHYREKAVTCQGVLAIRGGSCDMLRSLGVGLCNSLQCHAMQCYAMLCNALQCSAMLCNAVQCYAKCYAMLCNAMQCFAMLWGSWYYGEEAVTCYGVVILREGSCDMLRGLGIRGRKL